MKFRNKHLLFAVLLSLAIAGCKKDEEEPVIVPPTPTCNDGAHIGFTSLATDVCDDGASSSLLDGTRFEYKYDSASDSLWFLLTVNSVSNPQAIGVNVMVNVPGLDSTFNFWGTHNTNAYHRLLTTRVIGSAPSSYSGVIGISDAAGVLVNNFTNLSHDNISINVDVTNKTILLGLKRTDLLADSEFVNNIISVHAAAAVGSNSVWNDDVFNASVTMDITKNSPGQTLAVLVTDPVSNITSNSATSGGNVVSDGGAAVTSRGIVVATHSNPTTADNVFSIGSGTGTFVSNMSGLSPNTICYVRAYATNSVGTAYGNEVAFTTLANVPTVTTEPITNVTSISATSGGNVTGDGGATVISRGIAIATHSSPLVSDIVFSSGSGLGSFVTNISSLNGNVTYYVRAYATNSAGTGYGNEVSFTTPLDAMSLDSIYFLYTGTTTYLPLNKKINVTVTSNFVTNMINNRNIYVQDNTAGIMIRFDVAHTFALGTQLEIDVSGVELSSFNGVIQLNNVPLVNATAIGTGTVTPITTTIAGINSNYNFWKSKVVKINGVTITGSGIYSGYNTLNDGSGASMDLFTASYATFAGASYPIGTVSITGILTEYNGVKEIFIRDVTDVQ